METAEAALAFAPPFNPTSSQLQWGGSRMSQNQAGKWARRAVWFTLAAVFTLGCNPLATLSFLTQSDPVKTSRLPAGVRGRSEEG